MIFLNIIPLYQRMIFFVNHYKYRILISLRISKGSIVVSRVMRKIEVSQEVRILRNKIVRTDPQNANIDVAWIDFLFEEFLESRG